MGKDTGWAAECTIKESVLTKTGRSHLRGKLHLCQTVQRGRKRGSQPPRSELMTKKEQFWYDCQRTGDKMVGNLHY